MVQLCIRTLLCLALLAGNTLNASIFTRSAGVEAGERVYLNPNTGRFWTMDTHEGSQSDTPSLHKYLYGTDNPINRIDPSGRFDLGDVLAAGFISGVLFAIGTPYTANAPGPNDPTYPAITGQELMANFTLGFVFGVGAYSIGEVVHPHVTIPAKVEPPLANLFKGAKPKQGYSGVYNGSQDGVIVLRPSEYVEPGQTLPKGYVNARGGHAVVNQELDLLGYDTTQSYGFTVFLQEDGTLEVQWLSRSVNGQNFGNPLVPTAVRPQIIQILEKQTGKSVTKQ